MALQQPTVVLIHGLFGFRKLLWLEYFQGVRPLYESMGLRVIAPSLPWAGSIKQRADVLAQQLETESGPLHLIAHSMGGLDARRWISCLDGASQALSLTTLATPHHGSTAADHVCRHYSPFQAVRRSSGFDHNKYNCIQQTRVGSSRRGLSQLQRSPAT